ncbi:MAG: hypothetical protein IJ460_05610 [Clostridia bacterium]|nr:hypothetical protein [Clostridia bacterium]
MELAPIFTDSMVIQRDLPIKVFGTGDGTAKVSFMGETVSATAENGKWCATLSPRPFGGPYTMSINLGGEEFAINDIMIGDVFIAGGQSNMEMPLFKTEYGFEEAKYCKNDNIRYFTVARRYKPGTDNHAWHFVDMYTCDTPWQKCCEESSINFTAIGHYFAKYIHAETNVPVGIISCNWGGRKIEAFTAKEYLYSNPVTERLIKEFDEHNSSLDMEQYEIKYTKFLEDIKKYVTEIKLNHMEYTRNVGLCPAVLKSGSNDMPYPEYGPYDSVSPSTLWESMFSTIVPYGVRAFLWYQGESNGTEPDYTSKYLALLECLRDNFECDMDAYAVELAPWLGSINACIRQSENILVEGGNWAFLREQQQLATETGKKNYLVTTQELGDMYDIHPKNKKDVAYRLALKVLKYTYGMDIKADQPVFRSAEFAGGKAYITLDHADGLFGNVNEVLMYIAGKDRVPHRAKVEILPDNRLCVYSDAVPEPVLVRYAFCMHYFGMHLYNDAGLPLAPFRTDK